MFLDTTSLWRPQPDPNLPPASAALSSAQLVTAGPPNETNTLLGEQQAREALASRPEGLSRPVVPMLLAVAVGAHTYAGSTGSPAQRLLRDGYAVLDGVLEPADVRKVKESCLYQQQRGAMRHLGQDGRDDSVMVLDPSRLDHPAYGALSLAAERLLSLPGLLARGGQEEGVTPEQAALLESAAVPRRLMLACYPASGGRYVAHLDNDPADPAYEEGPVGLRACDRVFTCILYLNDEWEAPHEGCLRIFTAAVDEAAARSGEGLDEGSFVDVEPKGGRLVIFDSRRMLHAVRPSRAERWALTVWI